MTASPSAAPSPLAIPAYRLFWIARFSAVVATMAMVVILGWQVYDTARNNGMSPREAAPMVRSSWQCPRRERPVHEMRMGPSRFPPGGVLRIPL